jgi:hypothetical protein
MAIEMKLHTTESFGAWGRKADPVSAFARGRTAPIFRRLHS